MKRTLTALAIASAALSLGGCTTAQTLVSQFSDVPLPDRVARQQYGVCDNCAGNPQPHCVDCRRIQLMRRDAAGLSNKAFQAKYGTVPSGPAQGRTAPAGYRQNQPSYNSGYNQKQGYQDGTRGYPPNGNIRNTPSFGSTQNANVGRALSPFTLAGDTAYIVPNSGRVTQYGNPYPVRWYSPNSLPSNDTALNKAVLMEQIKRVNQDPELAASFLEFSRAQDSNSYGQTQRSSYSRPQASYGTGSRQSGYAALGY